MKDAIVMWRDTRMVVLTALIAATYAAVLIPFKVVIPLIPGFTEFRPASVIPIVFSLLFGPAAAWGSGMGNLIGDMLGTFGPGSAFGFVGNFLYGYLPYKLWGRMGILSSGKEPITRSGRQMVEYLLITALASAACALFIAWGLDMLGLVPFNVFANLVVLHNLAVAGILGPPLLAALYPRAKKWGLLWAGRAVDSDRRAPGRWAVILLLVLGLVSGYVIGNAHYLGASAAAKGSASLALGLAPSMAIMLVAIILL